MLDMLVVDFKILPGNCLSDLQQAVSVLSLFLWLLVVRLDFLFASLA